MKTYVKPDGVVINKVSEGVYAASGSSTTGGSDRVTKEGACYTTTAYIHQTPEEGRKDFRIQVNAVHNTTHATDSQRLVISFNVPVNYQSSNGSLFSGDGTNELTISYAYHNNATDNIGLGDVVVTRVDKEETGLLITDVDMKCAGNGDF